MRNVLDADLMEEASDHLTWLRKRFPQIPGEQLHHFIYRNDPFWIRLVSDERLISAAASVMPHFKPDDDAGVALFSSHYFCKDPGSN